ncbi:anthrone oxygenase family protein [Pseudonocardia sp.]|uniref:anthrone oxygenase family protein n=1 Tax=Pseudonocardia sp. TaxID=60912 RepID=UPI0025F1FC3A|nr:anthrone oxygenase family protein [Pseudonocardia sp.]
MAGVYTAFSVVVMPALRRRPAAEGAALMQEVNRVIVNPVFVLLFAGTGVLAVVAAVLDTWAVVGAVLYVLGSIGLTVVADIPLNNTLDADGERVWSRYLSRWTAWNHVRALATTAVTVALVVAA